MPNKNIHTASSQTSLLANDGTISTPSLLFARKAIYHHLLLFQRHFHGKYKTTIDNNNILIKAQLHFIATVSASETHSKRPVCLKVSERYYIVFALR